MADRVTCPDCSVSVLKNNLSRHRRHVHPPSSTSRVCRAVTVTKESRSRSSSRETATSDPAAGAETEVVEAIVSASRSATTYQLIDAARAMLQQHHLTSEEALCDYLRREFVGIPEHELYPLAVGALAGAQYAAGFHFLVERARASFSPDMKHRAIQAGSALALWNLGLDSFFKPPLGVVSSGESAQHQHRNRLSEPSSRSDPSEFHLPVSFQKSCEDFDVLQEAMNQAEVFNEDPDETVGTTVGSSSQKVTVTAFTPKTLTAPALPATSDVHVEPYVPQNVSVATVQPPEYQPTSIGQLNVNVKSSVESSVVDLEVEPDLIISAELDPIDDEARSNASTTEVDVSAPATTTVPPIKSCVTLPRSEKSSGATAPPDESKVHSRERSRTSRPRSRSPQGNRPPSRRPAPYNTSHHSSPSHRRQSSPNQHGVLLSSVEYQEFLRYQRRTSRK